MEDELSEAEQHELLEETRRLTRDDPYAVGPSPREFLLEAVDEQTQETYDLGFDYSTDQNDAFQTAKDRWNVVWFWYYKSYNEASRVKFQVFRQ